MVIPACSLLFCFYMHIMQKVDGSYNLTWIVSFASGNKNACCHMSCSWVSWYPKLSNRCLMPRNIQQSSNWTVVSRAAGCRLEPSEEISEPLYCLYIHMSHLSIMQFVSGIQINGCYILISYYFFTFVIWRKAIKWQCWSPINLSWRISIIPIRWEMTIPWKSISKHFHENALNGANEMLTFMLTDSAIFKQCGLQVFV